MTRNRILTRRTAGTVTDAPGRKVNLICGLTAPVARCKFVLPPALAVATMLLAGSAEAACRPFVAVGPDASYLVIEPDNWAVSEVGNYWGVGVWRVDEIVPGSTRDKPAFKTGKFEDIFTREPIVAEPPPTAGRPNAVVVLKQALAPRDSGWPPYHYPLEETEGALSPQWGHWLEENTFLRASEIEDAMAVYHLSAELEVLNVWDIGDMDLSMPFCAVGETLYFTDAANALGVPVAGGPSIERRPLAALTESGYELTPLHTKNCKALASRTSADDPAQLEYALYDIAADAIESEFASPAPARNILFAGGSRWLQQLAQDPAAEEPVPSATFRLIDTATGTVLRKAELDVSGGALIEDMQCDTDTPRAVIAGPRRIWLLDAETLSVVAENEIPFERDYFVFE